MSFVSDEFVIFYVVVTVLYFLIQHRQRWILLLAASYFFYGYFRVDYLILFALITVINYAIARLIDATPKEQQGRRRLYLALCIVICIGNLFIFKYFNFIAETINAVFNQTGAGQPIPMLNLLLPIGVSFYTFQSIAYTFDVYAGKIPVEKHLGIFATFISFFPQLVAGPIERASNLLPQFRVEHHFDYDRAVSGLRMILWGAFKKVVIADRLAAYANTVYNDVHSYTGIHLIIATFFFGIQIYCDFSGYSDIAIGAARLLGFDLMVNFRQPYLSRSIREFWRRWHISLSTWFRDYLYFPLGGNRVALPRHLLNLFIVFLVSGLWHGANWTFVIWGALHGFLIIAEELIDRFIFKGRKREGTQWSRIGSTLLTFGLVTFAWIFFRANSLNDAVYVITHLFDFSSGFRSVANPFNEIAPLQIGMIEFVMAFITIGILFVFDWFGYQSPKVTESQKPHLLARLSTPLRWAAYYAAILLVIYSVSTSQPDFIYFQF